MKKISPDEIKIIAKYIHDISGIFLDESKAYLLETRLDRVIKENGFSSFIELYRQAKADGTKSIERKIIDAISTNETTFFRDTSPFDVLQHKILPDLIDLRSANSSSFLPPQIRIWSAACSTGQEVYSIAIVLKELLPDLNKYNITLLGTDISDASISQSSYGSYNKFEIERGLPQEKLIRYFSRKGDNWKIKDDIRAMVKFSKQNLMLPLNGLGKFDIVFCRNVAIYFNTEDRKKLFDKIADILDPDGYLIIGAAESLTGVCPRFEPKKYMRSIFYQLKG
ncbi:MAG: protein-glutamate O-methyltransferase CheR [Candidatus Desulfatibia sp.]|uniref:CheR family methyltransferase n=1 Tax=Candidatus Desulfatibia sp. TaxID=3101189 RepID=UPI002F2FB164